jgi:predicted MFS family arabinose efflux permease
LAATHEATAVQQPGLTFRQALANRNFWLLGVSAILASIAVTGTLANFVGIAQRKGISLEVVALLQSLFGLSAVCGRVVVGLLVDRYRAQAIGLLFFAPAALAAICLSLDGVGIGGVALSFALIGLATGAEVDLCAYATSRYFGLRAYSRVFATLFQMLVIGGGIAAPLFGWMYDFTGSYAAMLATAAVCHLLAAVLIAMLGPYPDWKNGDPCE